MASKKKYEIIGVKPGPVYHKGKLIDLSNISDKEAKQLLQDPNFKYIKEKSTS